MIHERGDCGVRKLIKGRGRERGCGQSDGGRDGVAYYSEAMNGNACGMLVQGLGTRTSMTRVLYILCVTIVRTIIYETSN